MSISLDALEAALKVRLVEVIEREYIPLILSKTRIDTGDLRASTAVTLIDDAIVISQGGTEKVDYAIWVELKYQDFSRAVANLDWQFTG